MVVSSPYERWKQMAPAYLEKALNKRLQLHSQSIFAINCAIGTLFSGFGMLFAGSLTSDYKWVVAGVSLFSASLYKGHFIIERFRCRTSKYLYKIESLRYLTTEEGLKSVIEAISPTGRPREMYPKFLVKAGIVSRENYDRMLIFQECFKGLKQVPAELQNEWAAFQYILLKDLPHLP